MTDGFLLTVYKRGDDGGYLHDPGGIAVPHGDSAYVTKPAIAVAKLAKPVVWSEDNVADLVFSLHLTTAAKICGKIFSADGGKTTHFQHAPGAKQEEIIKYLNF